MGREVRMVPRGWKHPTQDVMGSRGMFLRRHKPMHEGKDYQPGVDRWDIECAEWKSGNYPDHVSAEHKTMMYEQYAGQRPHRDDYMPLWSEEEATMYMMYEDTSEGTPISPAFETPEELARWLADSGASWFGDSPASYEDWLAVARGGFSLPLVYPAGE